MDSSGDVGEAGKGQIGRPSPTADEILAQLKTLDREPFMTSLAAVLDSAPDGESIKTFAKKYPDRWAQCAAILARLSGYSDKTQGDTTNVYVNINSMSDAELQSRFNNLLRQILPQPMVIEHQP